MTEDAVITIADRLFTAIEHSDAAVLEEMWSPDIAVWRTGVDVARDKTRALKVLLWFIAATTARRYEILDREVFTREGSAGFVQQHILHATGQNGGSISMRICIVIKVGTDGLITRIDEYFDPAEMVPLLTDANSQEVR